MTTVRLRTALAVVWLVLGLALLLRTVLFPPAVFAGYDPTQLTLGGWLAVALAAWNGLRAFRSRALRPVPDVNPLRTRQPSGRQPEYRPEFDFTPGPNPPGDAPPH